MLSTIRLLLIVAVIVLAVMWVRGRDRRVLQWLGGATGTLALLLVITGLINLLGVNDQRQIEGVIKDMAAAVKARDVTRIFEHVSDSFELDSGTTKPMFREFARQRIDNSEVSDVEVWDFGKVVIAPAREDQPATATIHFKFKPRAENLEQQPYWECDAVFVKEADGQWRLKSFKVFLPQHKDPYPIPQLSH